MIDTKYFLHAASILGMIFTISVVIFPLPFHLHEAMFYPGDNFITMWTTAWQVHALQTGEPFWDANILHPYQTTLALSVLRVIYVPFAWLFLTFSNNYVLMENLIVYGSIILSGLGMYALCYQLTKSHLGAMLAGIIFTCNPERFSRLPHPHQLNPIFFAPALIVLHYYLKSPKVLYAILLTLCLVLQFLTSIYLFVFTVFAVVIVLSVFYQDWLANDKQLIKGGLIGIPILIIGIAPFAYPYLLNRAQYEFSSAEDWMIDSSARALDYLVAWNHNWLYGWTEAKFLAPRVLDGQVAPNFLFPGLLPIILLVIGIFVYRKLQAKRLFMMGCALLVAGFLLSLGPWLHLGTHPTSIPMPAIILYELPGFSVIRVPARFAFLVTAGLAMCVAAVVPWLIRFMPQAKVQRYFLCSLMVGFTVVECLNKPLPLTNIPRHEGFPPVEHWLKDRPEKVVVYYPLRYHLTFMYFSTLHWKTLVNGWSGYLPKQIMQDELVMNPLVTPEAIATLKERGAELIVIYKEIATDPPLSQLTEAEEQGVRYYLTEAQKRPEVFEKLYEDESAVVFRLE